MKSKEKIIEKILEFYGGYKESTEEVEMIMYRSSIESFLWVLGNKNISYLEEIMNAGGRETDEPFIRYMDFFCETNNLDVFLLKYEEIPAFNE